MHLVHTYVQLNAGDAIDGIFSSGYGSGYGELTVVPLAIF